VSGVVLRPLLELLIVVVGEVPEEVIFPIPLLWWLWLLTTLEVEEEEPLLVLVEDVVVGDAIADLLAFVEDIDLHIPTEFIVRESPMMDQTFSLERSL
jgi:hypothetical protein